MARRLDTRYKPYRVVSVVKGRKDRTADFQEAYSTEDEAVKHAEKSAKLDNVISVYVQKVDEDGYIIDTKPFKRPSKQGEGDSDY